MLIKYGNCNCQYTYTHNAVNKQDMMLLYNITYMNYPYQIHRGGARK